MPRILSVAALAVVTMTACGQSPPESTVAPVEQGPARGPVEGVWRVTEVTVTGGPDAGSNTNPQPGLYFFGRQYYSIMRVDGLEPRAIWPEGVTRDTVSDEVLRNTFGPFVANAGTYTLENDTVTMRPNVALLPNVMIDGSATATYRVEGDTLWLTQRTGDEPVVTTERRLERVE